MKAEKRIASLGKKIAKEVKEKGRGTIMALLSISPSTIDRWMKNGVPESKKNFVNDKFAGK